MVTPAAAVILSTRSLPLLLQLHIFGTFVVTAVAETVSPLPRAVSAVVDVSASRCPRAAAVVAMCTVSGTGSSSHRVRSPFPCSADYKPPRLQRKLHAVAKPARHAGSTRIDTNSYIHHCCVSLHFSPACHSRHTPMNTRKLRAARHRYWLPKTCARVEAGSTCFLLQ